LKVFKTSHPNIAHFESEYYLWKGNSRIFFVGFIIFLHAWNKPKAKLISE